MSDFGAEIPLDTEGVRLFDTAPAERIAPTKGTPERIHEYAMSHPGRRLTLTADDRSAADRITRAIKATSEDERPAYKIDPARWVWPNGAELVVHILDTEGETP